MKKILSLLLASVIVASMFAGCQSTEPPADGGSSAPGSESNTDQEPGEVTTIKYVVPGNAPADEDMVMSEVNSRLKDAINVELEIEYIPWDVWDQKINLKLTTGEAFDLFQIMEGRIGYVKYAADGATADITQYIEDFGPAITANIPESLLKNSRINDKLYTIPTHWYEPATAESCLIIRKDIRDAHGFKNPTTPKEIIDQIEAVSKDWEGDRKPYMSELNGGSIDPIGSMQSAVVQRSYDRYPFIVKDQLAIFYEDNTMASWIESDEFKQDALYFADAYKRGAIYPDILTVTREQKDSYTKEGNWYIMTGTSIDIAAAGIDPDDIEVFYLNPEKPYMRPVSIKNSNAVPYTSEHPAEAVKFVNWLYESQENYDLFMYGIEGTHYNVTGEHNMEAIIDPNLNAARYSFADWMIGNVNLIRYNPADRSQAVYDVLYQPKDDAIDHKADGFSFDATPVQTEFANVNTAIATFMVPVYSGVVNYNEGFDDALKNVKAAGLDVVMEEYRSQYEDFLAR